ncbi:RICIN domain-containing protein [Streptomyces sp. Je 1-332]|uniref:RICIN domain-containing protein n=1 Tax=Streptomyces sp. Je 1-332 TaxID=3231270 RepID=UPI0034578492
MSPEESDTSLAARLRGEAEGESDQPVALLLARHWQATYDYSAICLAAWSSSASMVAAASFHRVLGQMASAEPGGALRPYLLVTVRETVRGWTVDERISALMPELRKPTGGRGMRAATTMTPEKRRLAARSFWALPAVAQCLLWHSAVEADDISIPAGLSGLSADLAVAALEQAREQFRAGILRGHRELAPTEECPLYNRILDVTIRRGGTLLPDVQQHLSSCRHCCDVTEQLSFVEGELGTLLAEAVLGWGARRYLESRPGRGGATKRGAGAAGQGGRHAGGGGRHRPPSHVALPGGGHLPGSGHLPGGGPLASTRTPSRALRTGAAVGSAALVATVLVIALSSGDGGGDGAVPPTGMTGMTGSHDARPSADPEPPSAGTSPPTSAGYPGRSDQGRLRNTEADLCLDIRGKAKPGAEVKLAKCSAAGSQQWSYDKNGLLSSAASPQLCLDSHRDDGVLVLGPCVAPSTEHADEVRYDLTARGELLPRWHEGLAVAPASSRKGAEAVVKDRDGSPEQRWRIDSSTSSPNSRSIKGRGEPTVKGVMGERDGRGGRGGQGGKDRAGAPRGGEHVCTGSTCEPTSSRAPRPGPTEAREEDRGERGDGDRRDGGGRHGERGQGPKGGDRRASPYSTRHGEAEERFSEGGCRADSEPIGQKRSREGVGTPALRNGVLGRSVSEGVPPGEGRRVRGGTEGAR